ncbi:SURP and G-patch domain-containing protein 1 [Borealophlyctis nickersoniae]|nr:SURP and G-patch domain-containing protein 1 [Borealophlyctis nickersoniae]
MNVPNANLFANDGSFLEQFLRQQQATVPKPQEECTATAQKAAPKPVSAFSLKRSRVAGKAKPLPAASSSSSRKPVSFDDDDDEEGDGTTGSAGKRFKGDKESCGEGLSAEERGIIVRTAEYVVMHGETFEEFTRQKNVGNVLFRFLFDPTSDAHKYYQSKLSELKSGGKSQSTLPISTTTASAETVKNDQKASKRSRWDTSNDTVKPDIASAAAAAARLAAAAKSSHNTIVSPSHYVKSPERTAAGVPSYTRYSNVKLPGMIRAGNAWVYPEDEIIDEGGTWEHKKRAEEIQRTMDLAQTLTSQVEVTQAHHLNDFLPKQELERFERQVRAVKAGKAPPPGRDEYDDAKLDESNVGFRLLKKQGWEDGKGLGKSAEGIAVPVESGVIRPDKGGLGKKSAEEISANDDDFDIYRKRMMLAYKYRPNPLNNPRRPY